MYFLLAYGHGPTHVDTYQLGSCQVKMHVGQKWEMY